MDGAQMAQELVEVEDMGTGVGMGRVLMASPWLQVAAPAAPAASSSMSAQTPSLYRYPNAVPWPYVYPVVTAPVDGDLYSPNCGDIFGQRGNLLMPAGFQQQASEEALYSGDFTSAQQLLLPNTNWTLPYEAEEDKLNELSGWDKIPMSPYDPEPQPLRPFQQVTTSRSGIRVKFMGPGEIGLGLSNHRQRLNSRGMQPLGTTCSLLPEAALEDDGVVEVEVSTSASHGPASERVTFNSIEEALESIESQSDLFASQPPEPVKLQGGLRSVQPGPAPGTPSIGVVADEKHDEVVKAAKSLFSKRTRTLYHWLYPDTSKTKLKATVSAAWDTLADAEKQFYLSQVLGRFGFQASSLMINPQLDGIKGLPTTSSPVSATSSGTGTRSLLHQKLLNSHISETQQAVDQLFASCADSDTWTSFDINPPRTACPCPDPSSSLHPAPHPCPPAPPPAPAPAPAASVGRQPKSRSLSRQTERKKRPRHAAQLGMLASDQLDEEVNILKRMREAKLQAELDGDAELNSQLETFRVMAQDSDRSSSCRDGDDFWRRTPDPEDIFTQLNF